MKKVFQKKSGIVVTIIILLICLISFLLYDYTKKDTVKRFSAHKEYMYNLAFSGRVREKSICTTCDETKKYTVIISLDHVSPIPTNEQEQFLPYYKFLGDRKLRFVVNANIFKKVEVNNIVSKKGADYYLNVEEEQLQLLSKSELQWLP